MSPDQGSLSEYPKPEEHDFYVDTRGRGNAGRRGGASAGSGVDKSSRGSSGAISGQGWVRASVVGGREKGTGGDGASGDLGQEYPRPLIMHSGATKDLKKMDPQVRKKAIATIEAILSDDQLALSNTHRMYGKMQGWNSTKVTGAYGHRVLHQPIDDGGIHVGYVGLHEYGEAQQRLSALADQQEPYSTAFTAPGYYHDFSHPDEPKTGALHDISAPTWHSYGNSHEEREAAEAKNAKENEDFQSRVKQEAGLPDDTPRYEVKSRWERGITHALTMGDINIDQAEERGYSNDAREHGNISTDYYGRNRTRKGGWRSLPKYVHHVSTDADAVMQQGLKTRGELGQKFGKGLGGGNDHTVSVTSDASLAPDIYHALHEHHAAATGKITPQQLMHYAEHPPEGVKPFDRVLRAIHHPESLDRLMRGVRDNHHYGDDAPGIMTRSDAAEKHPAWSPVEESKVSNRDDQEPLYTHWERPLTKDEHTYERSQFYKTFSTARQHAGGHRDPLFISNDPVAFSKADPKHFGILHLRSHEGAQGYPLRASEEHHEGADSGEWRLGAGSPFDLMSIERPTPRHLSEFGDQQHEAAVKQISGGDVEDGIMICLVPPASTVEDLVLEEGESADQLHCTIVYLGKTGEYSETLLGDLHEVVEAWAEAQDAFTAVVQGVGTFLPAEAGEQHVLWASIGAPGLHRLNVSLVDYLKAQGYAPRDDKGFVGHVTLSYGKHHFRFMPKVKRQVFPVIEIWVVVAGRWESIPLGHQDVKIRSA